MPQSLKCRIKKLCFKKQITEEERDSLLAKLDNHDKELIREFAEKLKKNTLYFEKYIVISVGDNNEIQFDFNLNEFIDELLKEYGVENKGE